MSISAVQTLSPHPPGDGPGICSQPSNGDSYMIINGENLLLMTGQFTTSPLQSHQDCVCVGFQPHCGRTLLHCFHGIFNLDKKYIPSDEVIMEVHKSYLTWCRRPCGLQMVTSLSYWLRNIVKLSEKFLLSSVCYR